MKIDPLRLLAFRDELERISAEIESFDIDRSRDRPTARPGRLPFGRTWPKLDKVR